MIRQLLSRSWLLATFIVLVAVGVLARLGIWQLDRLDTRRAFNARVFEQQSEPPLALDAESISLDLYAMEYRQVVVHGHYISQDEILLRNQNWQGQLGMQLFTPLLIDGTQQIILVQRGWIPTAQTEPKNRTVFHVADQVTVAGVLRRAETDFALQLRPDPTLSPDQSRHDAWNNLDLDRLATQMAYPLLPVYLQRLPDGIETEAPYAQLLDLELTEGPHLGYAGQWFLFALILGLGYPFYVKKQDQGKMAEAGQ